MGKNKNKNKNKKNKVYAAAPGFAPVEILSKRSKGQELDESEDFWRDDVYSQLETPADSSTTPMDLRASSMSNGGPSTSTAPAARPRRPTASDLNDQLPTKPLEDVKPFYSSTYRSNRALAAVSKEPSGEALGPERPPSKPLRDRSTSQSSLSSVTPSGLASSHPISQKLARGNSPAPPPPPPPPPSPPLSHRLTQPSHRPDSRSDHRPPTAPSSYSTSSYSRHDRPRSPPPPPASSGYPHLPSARGRERSRSPPSRGRERSRSPHSRHSGYAWSPPAPSHRPRKRSRTPPPARYPAPRSPPRRPRERSRSPPHAQQHSRSRSTSHYSWPPPEPKLAALAVPSLNDLKRFTNFMEGVQAARTAVQAPDFAPWDQEWDKEDGMGSDPRRDILRPLRELATEKLLEKGRWPKGRFELVQDLSFASQRTHPQPLPCPSTSPCPFSIEQLFGGLESGPTS